MALSTYDDLVSGVRDWLGRSSDTTYLPTTRVADLIVFAETDIYARLRVREMETAADLTVSAQTVALPSGYLETRRLYLDGTPLRVLEYYSPATFWPMFESTLTGNPFAYTIEGENIVLGPTPDRTYTGKHLYYRRLSALATATNTLFANNPDLFLYGALSHAAPFIGEDSRIPTWRGSYEAVLARVQQQSDRDRYSGAPLVIRPQ